jgi:hypothetical protein
MVMTMQDMLNFMLVAIGSALAAAVRRKRDANKIETRYRKITNEIQTRYN